MANLKQAHNELFRRSPDERHESLVALWEHCRRQQEQSRDRWHHPQSLIASPTDDRLDLTLGTDGAFLMNDWSFSQLCRLSSVAKLCCRQHNFAYVVYPVM